MNPAAILAIAAGALLGSIPFGFLITRARSGSDVRRLGSGNIGATNVLRASGPLAAGTTLLLDLAKGSAAVLLARALCGPAGSPAGEDAGPSMVAAGSTPAWAAFAAVAGHAFSPWIGFRGGRGVATALGSIIVLSPRLALAGVIVFGVVLALTRIVSLSSIAGTLTVPALSIARPFAGEAPPLPAVAAIVGLIVLRHASNIGRLLRGEEPRLGAGRRGPGSAPGGSTR